MRHLPEAESTSTIQRSCFSAHIALRVHATSRTTSPFVHKCQGPLTLCSPSRYAGTCYEVQAARHAQPGSEMSRKDERLCVQIISIPSESGLASSTPSFARCPCQAVLHTASKH